MTGTGGDALRIKVEMKADAASALPMFVASCAAPEISATGRSLDELRANLQRAIADSLEDEIATDGTLEPRPILLEFAA
jgi:predicted RNase H-like HicB family nuclease